MNFSIIYNNQFIVHYIDMNSINNIILKKYKPKD